MEIGKERHSARVDGHPLHGQGDLALRIDQLQREIAQLQEAVVSHAVIDQAIGVVISLGGLRPDQGFEVLRTVSQRTNTKLRDIAEQIVGWVHSERLAEDVRQALETALADAASA
ncbi:ANTAR domain-containing protein [Streptomyces actinomycinicus]|uniref:ANTAR domain-containing protein n=1 Tax=Streptomyces actinomycinicus TaxID=1695166 RepID=A0A937JMF6_9ACTN|nr:ANTAR domain-containing protein [Streptomyces actinomycinicus]MBL1082271.1 ANTAR domain-containing protein [Streptomyces actinomycinicus]